MSATAADVLIRTTQLCRELVFFPGSVTDSKIVRALMDTRVAIVADARNLSTAGSQSLLVGLARLTLGYGASLRLVMPEVEVVGHQPPLRGSDLRAGLVDLAGDLVPEAGANVGERTTSGDLVFVVGDTAWSGDAVDAWRLGADPWGGAIGPAATAITPIATDFPVGPLASAAIAAAEPFKHAMRSLGVPLRLPEAFASFAHASVTLAPSSTHAGSVDLGDFDCISGGAIVNAALFALLRVPSVRGHGRVFEPQNGEASNVNRYVLMRLSRSRIPKIAMLEEWTLPQLSLEGHMLRVDDMTIRQILPLAPRVIVGTDGVRPRQLLQRQWPHWLVVGSTSDWTALVSEHVAGLPCAGCVHPEDEPVRGDIATVSFISFWAGLLCAARLLRHATGALTASNQQLTEVSGPLRLDSGLGLQWRAVQRDPACPIGC